ncbi:MAG: glutamate--tRNA ligase, partial [Chthoniobacterales bacterium]|nr:glutamate--tRNA ligase [Chthoniobacterales bacterium]
KRNTTESYEAIFKGLHWLGITWDEGPDIGGPYGPYFQSQRNTIYEKYLNLLDKRGFLYEDQGAIRFRSPRKKITVADLVCGNIEFDLSNPITHPDMTIRRPDGSWIFHFVNVIDDIEMQISHVIRGEDHLSNTPKHIELYHALDAVPPLFAHIPLILNKEGKKLSKRDGGASLDLYIEKGYAPEAVANYLCLLGWSPKDNREFFTLEEIIQKFELSQINRRNAVFDTDKCYWLQGQHTQKMPLSRYRELALPYIQRAGINYPSLDELDKVLEIVKEKVRLFSDIPSWIRCFFDENFEIEPEAQQKVLSQPGTSDRLKALRQALAASPVWQLETIEATFKNLASQKSEKTGNYIHPARVAVSGRTVGPSLYHMLQILGQEKTLARLQKAEALAS